MVDLCGVWQEPADEQSGWGPTREVVARLHRDGYHCEERVGPNLKTLVIVGRKLDAGAILAIGAPPSRGPAGLDPLKHVTLRTSSRNPANVPSWP
jgi:hypothetical protein